MKAISVILWTIWFGASFLFSTAGAEERVPEEYVYLLKSEGGKVYRIIEQATGEKKETVRKEIRRMELISPGTVLEIEKGASVVLTCGGCRTLNLSYKNSPFVIKMEDFKREKSTTSKLFEYFAMALNNYIHPDSKPVSKVRLTTRGGADVGKIGLCRTVWPPDNADIIPIEPFTFKWGLKGAHFSLEIKEFETNVVVYSGKTSLKKIDVPAGIFRPGRRYEWSLLEEETGEKCKATFALLSREESRRIMQIVNDLPTLLPPETDKEMRCRLQAGYFLSEGLGYDAWKWLDQNGISQPDYH